MMNPLFHLHAGLNRFFFRCRNRFRLGRKHYVEKPAEALPALSEIQQEIIGGLKERYGVCFEKSLNAGNALENYHLLDLLDRFPKIPPWPLPHHLAILDVGSKNFYYASTLHHFFKPAKLTGLEIDAYRIYRDWQTRLSYARYYIRDLPEVSYEVGDFMDWSGEVNVVLFFFPFVVPDPLVNWGLPLTLFKPKELFVKASRVLKPKGYLFMVNHGEEEFEAAKTLALEAGFAPRGFRNHADGLLTRSIPPQVSLWQKV